MPGFLRRTAVQLFPYVGDLGEGPTWSATPVVIWGTVSFERKRQPSIANVSAGTMITIDDVSVGTAVNRNDKLVVQGVSGVVQDVRTSTGPLTQHLTVTATAGP